MIKERLLISIGLHSGAIIAFQLALMQLISMVQWHHFAYMIISVAMLGFGASGTVLALNRNRLLEWSEWLVPLLMTISGLFMMMAFRITRIGLFSFDAYLLFAEWRQFPVLLSNYIIYFVPFFTGALAIGIIFIKHAEHMGTWYFSNLLGSGLGGVAFLLVFGKLMPQQLPAMIGMLSVIAGAISITGKKHLPQLLAILVATTAGIALSIYPGKINPSQYKDLARSLTLPDAKIIYKKPDIHGLITVVESPALRYAPALSLTFTESIPVKKNVFVRGDFYGVIPLSKPAHQHGSLSPKTMNSEESNDDSSHIHDFTTQALPFIMGQRENVLVLKAGTGVAISHALVRKSSHIDAIVENRGVISMMKTTFAEESGHLFTHPAVHIHATEARNFLASQPLAGAIPNNDKSQHHATESMTDKKRTQRNVTRAAAKQPGLRGYDLILLPTQESFGGSAGIHALQEDYSLTLEAFSLMWDLLSEDGVISVNTWLDYPSRASLKLLATLAATARDKGIKEPGRHIAAIRSWGTIGFVLKKNPITETEQTAIRQFCNSMGFDPLLLPNLKEEERMYFNHLGDTSLFDYIDAVMQNDESFFDDYGFLISPATDNKPYFSQFLKLGNFRQLTEIFGQGQLPFLELGLFIVLITLLQSTILALLFIVLPLFRLRKSSYRKTATLLYFAALGIGYMFVEIILIQRFVMYFGQPVYAISAVISTMLVASGAGSLYSESFTARPKTIAVVGTLITVMLITYVFVLTPILQNTISWTLGWKVMVSLTVIGIPSFLKGMMFPLGIRYLSQYDKLQTPWAWGINGSLSVVSTSLATLIAVEAGFIAVMITALGCYLLATVAFSLFKITPRYK